jgi:nucleoside-diphosphate-sugar epimerase
MTNRILLCGATGLVGTYLLPRLDKLNFEVTTFGRTAPTGYYSNQAHLDGDLNSLDSAVFQELDFDAVVYLAQCRQFREFPESSRSIFSINTASVIGLLEICRKKCASKFIYLSTGGVYEGGDDFIHEESKLVSAGDSNFYIKSKLMAEMALSEYTKYLDIVVFRPFFIYGHGQARGMLIPRLYDSVVSGSTISLQEESGIEIFPLHAADMADAILYSLGESGSGTFNIAGPDGFTIRRIAEIFARDASVTPSFEVSEDRARHFRVKSEKLYREFRAERRSLMSHLADVRP